MHLSDDRLSAYLDGELTSDAAAAAAAHLGACATCAGSLRLFSGLDEAIAAAPALSCASVAPLLSAQADAQLGEEEAGIVSAHLEACADCRGDVRLWTGLEQTLAAMPPGKPSRRVDEAIAALGRKPVRRAPRIGIAWPVPTLAVVTALTLVMVLSLPSAAPLVGIEPGPIVAAAQEQILDQTTNTLYTLDTSSNTVTAIDATTRESKGLIHLGGKPTALVMNYAKGTLVVWDSANKTFVEVTPDLSAVASTTAVDVPGTVTSVQADPKGNLVVGAVVSGSGPAASASAQAVIATVDGGTGQVQAVRQVDVAPQIIVIEPNGRRALLVSAKSTILADAATYSALGTARGGIGAAFAIGRDDYAVLSNGSAGAVVTFGRGGASVSVGGTPHAIVALPGGGYAVLSDLGARGAISVMNGDGALLTTLDAPAGGKDLRYDDLTGKFAIVRDGDVSLVALPIAAGRAPAPSPSSTPLPTAQTTPQPSATPTPAPTEAPVVVAPRERDSLVPASARALWPGTYFVSVNASQRPVRAAIDGSRIWYVDENERVNVLHVLDGGGLFQVASLPQNARVSFIAISPSRVYFVDPAGRTVHVLSMATEQISSIPLPPGVDVVAVAASPDERLWMATRASGLVSYDPRGNKLQTVAVGDDLAAVAVDSLGRVWTASRARQAVDLWDPLTSKLTEYGLAHAGAITALGIDANDSIWVGTDAGQTFVGRNVSPSGAGFTGGVVAQPISGIVRDQSAQLYYVSRTGANVSFGWIRGGGATPTVPATASEPMFDSVGRAWQADPIGSGFYVTLPGGRS